VTPLLGIPVAIATSVIKTVAAYIERGSEGSESVGVTGCTYVEDAKVE
jgi:hypothetical protein